jgi:hypothetical protein
MKTETKKTTKTVRKSPSKRTPLSAKTAGGADLLKIAAKIREQLNTADAGPSRTERAMMAIDHEVQGNMTAGDYIIIAQYIRDQGRAGENQFFAAVTSFAEDIALEDAELNRLYNASQAKHKEAGYGDGEDETWPADKRPADVQKIFDAWWDRFDQLRIAILRQYGEDQMADLLLNDPDAFQDRVENGQKLFDEKGLGGSDEEKE